MRYNAFGEPILQPGSNVEQAFAQIHGTPEDNYAAWFLDEDPKHGWGCELRDSDDNTLQADGFESLDALREWLSAQGVEVIQ